MSFALTKIQPPRVRAASMAREDLESRLAKALCAQRVVLVCAPAGFGKTALLAHALGRLPDGTGRAWIAADEGDDLERLVGCMLAALEPCGDLGRGFLGRNQVRHPKRVAVGERRLHEAGIDQVDAQAAWR